MKTVIFHIANNSFPSFPLCQFARTKRISNYANQFIKYEIKFLSSFEMPNKLY